MSAPSAGNEQPWHFIVITDRTLLRAITKIHQYAEMLNEAPVAILVCADVRLQKYDGYWVHDCAAATENMLIEATDLGLGGVWLGVHPIEERISGLKKMFDLPEPVIPFSLLSLGHPAEKKPPKDLYLKERVHTNGWR
jgi:nitroreductase